MDNFTFYSPTFFEFGKDTEGETGKLVKRFGGTKVLIHYGGGSIIASGLLGRVQTSLAKEGIAHVELGGVMPNPRSGLVYKGIELCKEEGIDFILAVGGGSAIDSAKAIAVGALYDGDFWDFFQGKEIEAAIPVGTVLTIAAAGSEGSTGSVVTKEEGMFKRAINSDLIRPLFSVLNPELTQTLPAYQTACGLTDIFAHLYERYMTNTKDVDVTDRLIEALMLNLIKDGPRAIANPNDYGARANLMWTGMAAHNNSVGVGRDQDWTSHIIEHELSAEYDVAHGAGLAVVMPAVMEYNINHNVMRFAQAAVRVWGCQMDFENPENTAKAGIKAFREYLVAIGMPQTFAEIGAKEEDIEKMAHRAVFGDGGTGTIGGGFVEFDQNDLEKIYRMML
jgi:alcohol dehydrogenase YqhD (iron-dependent ADH family)